MKKIYLFAVMLLAFEALAAQVIVNEVDADSESIDNLEFIELKTENPFQALDGYVLVLFNGSNSGANTSYFAYDLDGYQTNVNGTIVIGSNFVSPVPEAFIYPNTIQNGADAVAVYKGDAVDFPDRTLATTTNLVDALVYDTGDAIDHDLLNLLGLSTQTDEDKNGNREFESVQRNADGTYFVGPPTPGRLNDGSGVELIGVGFSVMASQYSESDAFVIEFYTEKPVSKDLTFSIELENGTFDAHDFTGNKSITIPAGGNQAQTQIALTDDDLDEGDEVILVRFGELPNNYVRLNNRQKIRVVDNDYQVAAYGTPLNPTYTVVKSTAPKNYYASLDGLSSEILKDALQDIIANPKVVRAQTYSDIIDILKEADENPANSNQVWLLYTEKGKPKLDFQTTSDNTGKWNREHVYPRSRGDFYSIKEDRIADGPDVYWTTNADSLRHGNSDAHALRASLATENSSRGNQDYGEYAGPEGNKGSFKGDVARSVFYMAVRYNGLKVVPGNPPNSTEGQLGDLDLLLQWHRNDPPDDFEMHRNNVVYTWQNNRNPFIDQPQLVEYLWGKHKGEKWDQTLSVNTPDLTSLVVFPNPTAGKLKIVSPRHKKIHVKIYSTLGECVLNAIWEANTLVDLSLPSGLYLIKIGAEGQWTTRKIVLKK